VNPSRSVVADASRTFTAIFTTEYFLTMASSPSPATSVTPGSGWHPEGDIVSISTNAPADGSRTVPVRGMDRDAVTLPSAQTTTITMDGPKSITATWNHQYKIDLRFAAGVPGRTSRWTTVSTPAPASLWLDENSQHVVNRPIRDLRGRRHALRLPLLAGGGCQPAVHVNGHRARVVQPRNTRASTT